MRKKEDIQAMTSLTNWLGATPIKHETGREEISEEEVIKKNKIVKDEGRKRKKSAEDPVKKNKVQKLLEFFQPTKVTKEHDKSKERRDKMLEKELKWKENIEKGRRTVEGRTPEIKKDIAKETNRGTNKVISGEKKWVTTFGRKEDQKETTFSKRVPKRGPYGPNFQKGDLTDPILVPPSGSIRKKSCGKLTLDGSGNEDQTGKKGFGLTDDQLGPIRGL